MQEKSKKQWLELWQRINAHGNGEEIYRDLVTRYSEQHRAYHTFIHIEHCLDKLELVRHLAENPDAIEMAIWYHDAVYDTHSKNNEQKSADLIFTTLKNASVSEGFAQSVTNLILATKHTEPPTELDTQFLVDIDLSILGQPDEIFDEYERQVRKEYEWVPDEAFMEGRSKILKSFLERPNIYSTQFFRNKYETQARKNISRSIAQLSNHP